MKNEIDTLARVRQLAAERHMSLSCLARTCGIHPSTFSAQQARGGQLQVDTIIRICDALELSLGEFFTQ